MAQGRAVETVSSHLHIIAGYPRVMVQVGPIGLDRHNDAAGDQEAIIIDGPTRSTP